MKSRASCIHLPYNMGCRRVSIQLGRNGLEDGAKTIVAVAWSGSYEERLKDVDTAWGSDERVSGIAGDCKRTGRTHFIQHIEGGDRVGPWLGKCRSYGFRSIIALPMKDEERTFGLLMLYPERVNGFTTDWVELLEEMAGDLAFGISALGSGSRGRGP